MQQSNGYSEVWAEARKAGNIARGVLMLMGTALTLYFLLRQDLLHSPIAMAVAICLLTFTLADAVLQIRRFLDQVTRPALRHELQFDGAQLHCKPSGQAHFPILREQCRAYYPCRETIALDDGRLLELRPPQPAARYWGTPYTYFTRTLFEAWWPDISLDALEQKALNTFPGQRATVTIITSLAVVTLLIAAIYVRILSFIKVPPPDNLWLLVLSTVAIAVLWPAHVWDQLLKDSAIVQLSSTTEEVESTTRKEQGLHDRP